MYSERGGGERGKGEDLRRGSETSRASVVAPPWPPPSILPLRLVLAVDHRRRSGVSCRRNFGLNLNLADGRLSEPRFQQPQRREQGIPKNGALDAILNYAIEGGGRRAGRQTALEEFPQLLHAHKSPGELAGYLYGGSLRVASQLRSSASKTISDRRNQLPRMRWVVPEVGSGWILPSHYEPGGKPNGLDSGRKITRHHAGGLMPTESVGGSQSEVCWLETGTNKMIF